MIGRQFGILPSQPPNWIAIDPSVLFLPVMLLMETPPADAFWSLTTYDDKGFQVPNSINRFAIGDRDKLKLNEDGLLDIYIQPESPGVDKESNWLPSPKSGAIGPTLRIYSPRTEALNGTWAPPPLMRIN